MNNLPGICLLPVFIALACVSCEDDPKLVEQRGKQRAEIARLNLELAVIEEKLKNIPPDMSVELEKVGKEAETQTAEVARLEAEVAELAARKRSLQSEFDAYRAKYQIK
jgi:chromosome segregation ATPase